MKNLLSHKQLLTKSNEALMLNNSLNELIEKNDDNTYGIIMIADALLSSVNDIKALANEASNTQNEDIENEDVKAITCPQYDVIIDGKRINPECVNNIIFDDANSILTIRLVNHFIKDENGETTPFLFTLPLIQHDIFDTKIEYINNYGHEIYTNCQLLGIRRHPLNKKHFMPQVLDLNIRYEYIR